MKMLFAATAGAALFAAAPGFAAQDNVQDKKPEETARADKRICRSQQVTGSMMAKRECHTAAEWKQQDDQNAANVDALRNRPPSAMPR